MDTASELKIRVAIMMQQHKRTDMVRQLEALCEHMAFERGEPDLFLG